MEYWKIQKNKEAIVWDGPFDGHTDYLEMSGLGSSFIVTYGTDESGKLILGRRTIFPQLRGRPNNTHASFSSTIREELTPKLTVSNGSDEHVVRDEYAVRFELDGNLRVYSTIGGADIEREFFPSVDKRACIERFLIQNRTKEPLHLSLSNSGCIRNEAVMGCMGVMVSYILAPEVDQILNPGEVLMFGITYAGELVPNTPIYCDYEKELEARRERIEQLKAPLRLDTGDDILDTMFEFSKIRAGESIFRTKNGLIHCPGGDSYYAAVWCNDQAEYSGPWFAFTGDKILLEAAETAYRWYIPFMDETYEPIPSSVIAEGLDYWNGAGDRGDAAMYLYGASSFCLVSGDREKARSLWNSIKWCAEYCKRKVNENGVIASDSDELETRFPAGDANLCTSSLCLMGLRLAAYIADDFGETELAADYRTRADELEKAIDSFFGATVSGYETYRYYDGNTVLRSWICMPLCADIFTRAKGTVDALTGPELFTDDGLLSQEGSSTVWDRSTLYGLRGIFRAGYTERAFEFLQYYCRTRLLGERVPYAIEAFPEGNKRHLSAESALFAQIVVFGLLGLKPTGFSRFELSPTLPTELDHLTLENICAFGKTFDIRVTKNGWEVVCGDKTIRGNGKGEVIL